ncbi:MAG: RNA polymerase sigma factor [Gaiellales bacterium]
MALARQGDAGAFEELVHRHAGEVYGLLARALGDADLAEEASRETLRRAWCALPSIRGDAAFSTRLLGIAVSEASCLIARQVGGGPVVLDDVTDPPDLGVGPAALKAASEHHVRLEQALRQLPALHRLPVVLRDVEGFTNEEAGELLGLDPGTFKSRLHGGRMTLRRLLERQAEGR